MLLDCFDQEEKIEAMIAKGRAVMREAIELYKPVAIFACYSSGNDSIVSTHFAATEYSAEVAMVDTLIGLDRSREHARRTCERLGWTLNVKKAHAEGKPEKKKDGSPWDESILPSGKWMDGETAYEEFVFNFGFPGNTMHARAYQRLKERSFNAFKREAKQGHPRTATVMFVSGIRKDESAIRAGYNRAYQKVGSSVWVNPFYYCTAADFEMYRQEFGLPRNPVSDAIGISGECLCGCHAKEGERERIRSVEPEADAYISRLEAKCEASGVHCKWGTNPPPKVDPRQFFFDLSDCFGDEPTFRPACVGCSRRQMLESMK